MIARCTGFNTSVHGRLSSGCSGRIRRVGNGLEAALAGIRQITFISDVDTENTRQESCQRRKWWEKPPLRPTSCSYVIASHEAAVGGEGWPYKHRHCSNLTPTTSRKTTPHNKWATRRVAQKEESARSTHPLKQAALRTKGLPTRGGRAGAHLPSIEVRSRQCLRRRLCRRRALTRRPSLEVGALARTCPQSRSARVNTCAADCVDVAH